MPVSAALSRRRDYAGPAFLSYGFRPFFLGAALWSAGAILLWLPVFSGSAALPTALNPVEWHAHAMLYGFVPAAVAGFLLTAIPNWTGRLPVNGLPLAALFALWVAGRLAMLWSAQIGAGIAAAIDLSFLVVLLGVTLREVIAGKNWRNLRVLVVLAVLFGGNLVFHFEFLSAGHAVYGIRIGVAAILMLIMLVGGRIVPSFTHNWLSRNNPGRLPLSFSRYDAVAVVVAAMSLVVWIAAPWWAGSGMLLLAAGGLHVVRLLRWAGDRTFGERLVLVLHVAYAFVPVGFLLTGSAILWPSVVPLTAGLHAWTAGAIGTMTLAVMTRATLGHTGQPLVASPATQMIYLLVALGALGRIAAAFVPAMALLQLAASLWAGAFALYALSYGRLLLHQRA